MNDLSVTGGPIVMISVDAGRRPDLKEPQAAMVAVSLAIRSLSRVRGQVAQVSSGRTV